MISIGNPYIRHDEGRTFLCCKVKSDIAGLFEDTLEKELFYSVPFKYAEYLVTEVSDSFLIISILPALMTHEDIRVEGYISSSLYYNIKTIIYLLSRAFKVSEISVDAKYKITDFEPKVNATGFSGGVDSFCTFLNHTSEECPENLRVGLLTLFNVGAYGNVYEDTKVEFTRDVNRALAFADEIGLPILDIDSNIGVIFSHPRIFHYSLRLTLCLSSAVLAVGKLISNYYQSSGGTIDLMRLSEYDQAYYDDSLVHLLSTSTTTFHIAESYMNRVEKTKRIAQSPLAYKHLYVCMASVCNANQGTNYSQQDAPNCGECPKCKRTLLTLDMLGVLPYFENRFDIKKYSIQRESMMHEVAKEKNDNHFYKEIYELMEMNGINIKIKPSLRRRFKSVIRKLGRKLFKTLG